MRRPETASYIAAIKNGTLTRRIAKAEQLYSACSSCPRRCGVNRAAGEIGFCKTGAAAVVCSYNAHFGEEAPLVGENGSGTIFFTHCNLMCNFCQNYEISHGGEGRAVTDEQLAGIMLALQEMGCHNINLVTPSHVVPRILSALQMAAASGLSVPIVYNSSGYDNVETLQLLDGIVDIYMPDFKFWDSGIAKNTCNAPDYPQAARAAIVEMHRQVGDLIVNANGIAVRGLLVRHLVLPNNLAGTQDIMKFIAQKISKNTYVNIMAQYRPCGLARTVSGMDRMITRKEYSAALRAAGEAGIKRLDNRRPLFGVL